MIAIETLFPEEEDDHHPDTGEIISPEEADRWQHMSELSGLECLYEIQLLTEKYEVSPEDFFLN